MRSAETWRKWRNWKPKVCFYIRVALIFIFNLLFPSSHSREQARNEWGWGEMSFWIYNGPAVTFFPAVRCPGEMSCQTWVDQHGRTGAWAASPLYPCACSAFRASYTDTQAARACRTSQGQLVYSFRHAASLQMFAFGLLRVLRICFGLPLGEEEIRLVDKRDLKFLLYNDPITICF